MKKTKLFLLAAAGLLAAAPASAQDINSAFDGTLQSFGQRYVTIPRDASKALQAWDVEAGKPFTISIRCVLNDMTVDAGLFGSRAFKMKNAKSGWFGGYYEDRDNLEKENTDLTLKGFEIFGGCDNTSRQKPGFGLNVSPNIEDYTGHLLLENGMQYAPEMVSEISYITVVFDPANSVVIFYRNGQELERQTKYKNAYSSGIIKTPKSGAYTNQQMESYLDFLIGARYFVKGLPNTHTTVEENGTTYRIPRVADTQVWRNEIDDIRIYNKALSPEEIQKDMQSGFPIYDKDNGLVLAHDFARRNAKGNYIDISGNGYNAVPGVIDGGKQFPAVRNITVTPVTPETDPLNDGATMGTLSLKHFSDGHVQEIATGSTYAGTWGEDFYAYAESVDPQKYELLGIYVNGVPVQNGTYFKAKNENTQVVARFRSITHKTIYLVGTLNNHTISDSYRFSDGVQPGEYTLDVPVLAGKFHIVELNNVENKEGVTMAYPFSMYEGCTTWADLKADDENYNLKTWAINLYATESQLYVNEKAIEEGDKYDGSIYDRDFTMVYSKDAKSNIRKHMLNANVDNAKQAYHFRVHPDGETWNNKYPNNYPPKQGIQTYAISSNTSNAIHDCTVKLYYPANLDKIKDGEVPENYFTVEYADTNTGVEEIATEDNSNAPVEYYNLNGIRVNGENLTPGLYIVRQGNKVVKRLVK